MLDGDEVRERREGMTEKDERLEVAVAALRKLAIGNNSIAMRRTAQTALAKIWDLQK